MWSELLVYFELVCADYKLQRKQMFCFQGNMTTPNVCVMTIGYIEQRVLFQGRHVDKIWDSEDSGLFVSL